MFVVRWETQIDKYLVFVLFCEQEFILCCLIFFFVFRACKADNEQLIHHLVDKLNMKHIAVDTEGYSILHIAVMNKFEMRYSITKRFPELLASINTNGQTIFHIACANNDIDYIKWLFEIVMKEKSEKSQTPLLTPIVTVPQANSYTLQVAIVEDEDSINNSTHSMICEETDSGLEVVNSPSHRGITEKLSSSEIKLDIDDEYSVPSAPLFAVNYHQYVKKMKLFSADANGENILHIMVKNDCHELMSYIFESWHELGVRGPTIRDFWLRATNMENPLDEAITRKYYKCLDVMLDAIVNQCDAACLHDDNTLLLKAVCSRSNEVINVLLKYGVHRGLDKTLYISDVSETLSILLFYKEVLGLIKGGEEYLTENSRTLDWRDYMLYSINLNWIYLASHAVETVKELFTGCQDDNHSLFMAAGRAVIEKYSELIFQPRTGMIVQRFTTVILSGNELASIPLELFCLPNLKELDLSNNRIEELPIGDANEMSYSCHHLKSLTVDHNLLTTLPDKLFLLPQLELVSAHHNEIKDLPMSTWISISLLTLNLSNNKLSRLHDLSGSQNQSSKDQKEENFQSDDSMKSKLDMFGAQLKFRDTLQKTRKLPSDYANLTDDTDDNVLLCCLKSLNLSSNSFTKLPPDLPCLAPKLEKLLLNLNPINEVDLIRDFPANILTLNMQSCKLKDVSCTRCESIPCGAVLCLLHHGKEVNEYCEHSDHEYLAKLNTLSLRNNHITSLQVADKMGDTYQALFPVLSVLDISNNQLSKVPDHLELLTELSSLCLSNNDITYLPSSISKLSHLWVIDVENLTFSNVPRAITSSHSAAELKNYLKHLNQK